MRTRERIYAGPVFPFMPEKRQATEEVGTHGQLAFF